MVAFGTLGILDKVDLKDVKLLILYANFLINALFLNPKLEILVEFFRYLNSNQLTQVVQNLLKYTFVKSNKINSSKF